MDEVIATYRQGQVSLDVPVDWPNGTRVAVSPVESEADAEASPQIRAQLSADEFERLVDEVCDIVDAGAGDRPTLSDFSVSREGTYRDHW